jgi:heme exporter protein A
MAEKLKRLSESVVDVAGVCKFFGSQVVLEDISFRLPGGQGLCICGANAAGKTTLLRIMTGLLQPDAGTVQICGFDVKTQAQQARAVLGAIFHKSMVYPQLTVLENLRFFARLYGVEDGKGHIQDLLEQIGLLPYRYDRAGVLSRGMMQRLAIARALVHKPIVLLADEPFTGLDVDASKHLVTILNNFKDEGGTIVMTTHDVNLSLQCCEHVAVLDKRKLIFKAKVCEINPDAFAKDYLLYARENHWAASPAP